VIAQNILQVGLWWTTVFKDAKYYARACDVCQRVDKFSHMDELPLHPVWFLQAFKKWAVDFGGPINPLGKHSKSSYIIIATNYLTRWDEEEPIRDCYIDTTSRFVCENIVTRFGFPRRLTNFQGTYFINEMISIVTREFLIQHHKIISYHP
jgi:hypothetical protein